MKLLMKLALAALLALPAVATTAAAPVEVVVVATDFQFGPTVITVPSGGTVRFVAGTEAFSGHSATSPGRFDVNPTAAQVGTGNDLGSVTLDAAPGTVINYFCKPHAGIGMRGIIVVV